MKTTPYPNWIIHPFKTDKGLFRLTKTHSNSQWSGDDGTYDTFINIDTKQDFTLTRTAWITRFKQMKLM